MRSKNGGEQFKPGQLVGWKYRNALVLGRVLRSDEDRVTMQPVSKPTGASQVTRHKDKVFPHLDEHDTSTAMARGGHMARRETTSAIEPLNAKFGGPARGRSRSRTSTTTRATGNEDVSASAGASTGSGSHSGVVRRRTNASRASAIPASKSRSIPAGTSESSPTLSSSSVNSPSTSKAGTRGSSSSSNPPAKRSRRALSRSS